ncbi:MAG: hypothetical protein ACRDZ2_07090 [Ilumatobacteraceae bacterium]
MLGSDGKVHLEYDLIVTDVMTAPVSLTSLVVRDGETELARLEGDVLKAVTFPFLSATPTLDIEPSAAVMTVVDVSRYEPVVIEPPPRGDGWLSFNACCTPTAHHTFLLATNGNADGELTVTPSNTPQEDTLPLANDIADFGE